MWRRKTPWRVLFGAGAFLNVLVVFALGGYDDNRPLAMVAATLMVVGGIAWLIASRHIPKDGGAD